MTRPRIQSECRRGFTLVEVLLVMVIIATLAALATPALRGFTKSRLLPNTSQELVTTARWCRQRAIGDGVIYRLNIASEDNSWSVTKDDGTGVTFTAVETDFIKEKFSLPQGISISAETPSGAGGQYISFYPDGRADRATVTLSSENVSVQVTCDTPLGAYYVVPAGDK